MKLCVIAALLLAPPFSSAATPTQGQTLQNYTANHVCNGDDCATEFVQLRSEIKATAGPIIVTIGSSNSNTRCVTSSTPVTCAPDAGDKGKRVNPDYAAFGDTYTITVEAGTRVCARRLDYHLGWWNKLQISCSEKAPTSAPTEAPTPAPTPAPTEAPTPAPTAAPTPAPTPEPTPAPTFPPTTPPPPPIVHPKCWDLPLDQTPQSEWDRNHQNCEDYVNGPTRIGCGWTKEWNCREQGQQTSPKTATPKRSLGYCCCCEGLYFQEFE